LTTLMPYGAWMHIRGCYGGWLLNEVTIG